MRSFQYMLKTLQTRRAANADIKELEEIFGESVARLRQIFAGGPHPLVQQAAHVPSSAQYLREIGINAHGHTYHIEVEQFPAFLNVVKRASGQVGHFLYQREIGDRVLSTMLSPESRFAGRTIRMLSNDEALMQDIAAQSFSPPPPWIAWYELGPTLHVSQGDAHYWLHYVWDPYWQSLTLEAQETYLAQKRLTATGYLSDEDWDDWVDSIRRRDPRTR